jgi:hypothetical protein
VFIASWKLRALVASFIAIASVPHACADDAVAGNGAPIIVSLTAAQVPGKKFRISGRVADETPASCSVSITGAATGGAQCDASGSFSVTCDVPTLGDITVIASDGQLSSTPAGLTLGNVAPTTTITAVKNGGQWTFSGSVADEAPAGLTVTLSGAPGINGRTVTVAANGSWSISVIMFAQVQGIATAKVTDWYGLTGQASTPFGN